MIWILCFALRLLSPEYFGAMPFFGTSLPSIIAGVAVGLMTVFLAARIPAKRAAKVSPLSAVSGNANDTRPVRKAANTNLFKVDAALGIHHAKSSRRNFILMVSSFGLSIILFLAFSVTIEFMNHTLRYGVFRAIGLSSRQLSKMIIAEAAAYAVTGSIVGAVLGVVCNKFLFDLLIGRQWGGPWLFPWGRLTVIVLIVLFSVVIAVYRPIRRIREMSIVDTISAQ